MSLLSLHGVSLSYGRRQVVRGVSLDVPRTGVTALLGPNGSGKTSLLRLMLGHCRPDAGTVLLQGRPLPAQAPREVARALAYVPQVHNGVFAYSVLEVVVMGRLAHGGMWGGYTQADHALAHSALDVMGIGHLFDRPFARLSGGEQKLTLLARALAQKAQGFVLDEPANHLDFANQFRLLEHLTAWGTGGRAVIFSTHCPDHALAAANQAVLLKDGRILASGPACQVLTGPLLSRLYDMPLEVLDLPGGRRACVPITKSGSSASLSGREETSCGCISFS